MLRRFPFQHYRNQAFMGQQMQENVYEKIRQAVSDFSFFHPLAAIETACLEIKSCQEINIGLPLKKEK